jgi:flagellar basal body rod protein FlgF
MRDGLFTAEGQDGGDFETGPQVVSVTSEMLEGSSASAMDVMVQMMAGQRSFEMKMKLISQFMDLSETNNTMMRLA